MAEFVLGVALSGGAVRGVAQCGVLAVLDEHEIPISVMAGTSAGSGVAAAYMAGVPPAEFAAWLQSLRWPDIAHITRPGGMGLFSLSPIGDKLEELIGPKNFSDLNGVLVIVATDLISGERLLIDSGPVIVAVQASSAVPGLFTPVKRGDMLLVDGGLVDNYPVTVPREYGATAVIGVDIGSEPNPSAPSNIVDVLIAAGEIRSISTGVRATADVHVVPDVRDFASFDFNSMPEMYQRGRKAALEALPSIEALIG